VQVIMSVVNVYDVRLTQFFWKEGGKMTIL
jgi:hypothetical protein